MNVVPLSMHSEFAERQAAPQPPVTRSIFPEDAQAVIYKHAPLPMTCGRAHAEQWKLRFERHCPSYIEPLMGSAADRDPLTQAGLSFPPAASPIAYARRP